MDAKPAQSVQTFRKSLAIGGHDGTLRRRFRTQGHTLVGQVQGKTGTLTSVIALSGFLTGEDGRTLCFSIVTNGHRNHRKRNVRLEHEEMVASLDHFLGKAVSEGQDQALHPEANTELAVERTDIRFPASVSSALPVHEAHAGAMLGPRPTFHPTWVAPPQL
jgi:hypothetical protein